MPNHSPHTKSQNEVLNFIKLMRPWAMRTTQKVRIGNAYDGGYVLPETVLECDVILSIGVGPDVSFDLELAKRGARVMQFDHSVEGVPANQQHENFWFEKLGWGTKTEGVFLSFDDMLTRMKTLEPKRAMLKFDIEGGEYDVIDAIDVDQLKAFDVIACEIHDMDKLVDPEFFARAKRMLEKLSTHHAPVHLHANNYQTVIIIQGVPVPKVLELSYLRRDLDHFPNMSSEPIPGPLDRPNHPGLPDICMNPF